MSAYDFPLLIKQLLLAPLAHRSTTEIVYRGRRYGYPMLRERIGRLGSTLCGLGVQRGDTVAVMDWDSHRYLECYFAIPMIGAVHRLKDLIKTGGEWVSSLELESIIGNDPDVAEVAVIGLPDPKWGERPAAVVVARAGVTLHAADIKARVMRLADVGVVPKYAVPAHVFFLAELPKTSVGKLDKKVLRQVFSSVSFVEAV